MADILPMSLKTLQSNRQEAVLALLADGRFHSGQAIADELGISRSAVWKRIGSLQADFGLEVHAVRGRGYRLAAPVELLELEKITAAVGIGKLPSVQQLHVLRSVDSTNTRALADPPVQSDSAHVWLTEHQTAGRGRRGRRWATGFGQGVAMSFAWRFDLPMNDLAPLSLVAGVAIAETLLAFGAQGISLKWPNDVLAADRKLCGILVEAAGEADGPVTAVIGLGINVCLTDLTSAEIDQPWIDLAGIGLVNVSRNALAGHLIRELVCACETFAIEGLAPFVARWLQLDRLNGQLVDVVRGNMRTRGVCRGISANGALCLEQSGKTVHFHAGEVSLCRATAT